MLFSDEELKEIGSDILKTLVVCLLIVGIPLMVIRLLGFFFN